MFAQGGLRLHGIALAAILAFGSCPRAEAETAVAQNDVVTVTATGDGVLAVRTNGPQDFDVIVAGEAATAVVMVEPNEGQELIAPREDELPITLPKVGESDPVARDEIRYEVRYTLNPDEEPGQGRVMRIFPKVDLEGYEAWRENDDDMVPDENEEEEEPGFLVTQKADSVGGSYDPLEAKIIAKGLGVGSGFTRWLRFSDHTKVRLWRTGWAPAGIVPASAEVQIIGDIDLDCDYEIRMEGTWDPGTSVTVDLFLKDATGNEVPDCSDTVRLLGPVVMPLGNSMTFGIQRENGPSGPFRTERWKSPWTGYPSAYDWGTTPCPAIPYNVPDNRLNPVYQGWRGYLHADLQGFAWDGEEPNGHGPKHMGYPGAKCQDINDMLDEGLTEHPGPYPKQAFATDPAYAIVVYFIGLNDMNSGTDPEVVYEKWKNGLQKILTHREGKGRTLIVGVLLPRVDPSKVDHYPRYDDAKLIALNNMFKTYTIPAGFTHATYRWTDTQDIPHDAGDDGLHYFAPGYNSIKGKILNTIIEGLQ